MADWLVSRSHTDPEPLDLPFVAVGPTPFSRPGLPSEQAGASVDQTAFEPLPVSSAAARILGMIGSAIVVMQTESGTMLVSTGRPGTRRSASMRPLPSPEPCPPPAIR